MSRTSRSDTHEFTRTPVERSENGTWKSVARNRELCFDLDSVCRSLVQPRILAAVGRVFPSQSDSRGLTTKAQLAVLCLIFSRTHRT